MTEELVLGNQFNFLRHVVTLESIGLTTVLVGRGVCIGIGTSTRGPAMQPVFISGSQPSLIKKKFYAGPLMEGMQTAAAQGCSVIGGMRVLGQGYTTASLALADEESDPVAVLNAVGPGQWGQIPRFKIDYGDLNGRKTEIFNGNGLEEPYNLLFDDIIEGTTDHIKVNGVAKTPIYSGTPDPGEAKLDSTGKLYFAAEEWPDETMEVEVRYTHKSRKITVQDEAGLPIVYNNLMDPMMIEAQMRDSAIATFDPVSGATHLPARTLDDMQQLAWVNMSGGYDGEEPTIDDYEDAFNALYEALPDIGIVPTSVFVSSNEATTGQKDIIALLDAFLRQMANGSGACDKMPCQGFVSLVNAGQDIMTDQEMMDFAEGYNNLFLTIISNGIADDERDLAAARAGQEAALALGISPATSPLYGVDGLLFQINRVNREVMTYGQLEVLVKDTVTSSTYGVHAYVGISTDPDQNFKRTVDVRTICQTVVFIDGVVKNYLNKRRTLTNLISMKTSIKLLLQGLLEQSVLDTFNVEVTPNQSDHNAVDIAVKIQPVGHIERVYTWLGVGYYDTSAVAA